MIWGFTTFKDIAEFVSYIVTSFSLAAIYFTYFHSKKQMHFATIEKCINDYRLLYDKYDDKYVNLKFLREYLDLVNEELFYIENDYLPKAVAEEWIDGMIDYLPFINIKNFVTSNKFPQLDTEENTENALFSYPRIYKFISLKTEIDFEKIFLPTNSKENIAIRNLERIKLIEELLKNLNRKKNIIHKILSL